MKKVLLIILIFALLTRNFYSALIPLQSAFFILALTKSKVLGKQSGGHNQPTPAELLRGTLYIFAGLALSFSIPFLISAELPDLFHFIACGAEITACFLCFYSLIALERLRKAQEGRLRVTASICAVLPCISLIGQNTDSEALLTVVIFLLAASALMLYTALSYSYKEKNRNNP